MSTMGHNGGPTMEAGFGFRKHAWTRARAALLPTLPLQVVRIRVKRAERLGLPYRTYATIRAITGRDIVAFLFSGNALDLRPGRLSVDRDIAGHLARLDGAAGRMAAVYAPMAPAQVMAENPDLLDSVDTAPPFTAPWAETRRRMTGLLQAHAVPHDGVVLVAATSVEREWASAGKLAGTLSAEQFLARDGVGPGT